MKWKRPLFALFTVVSFFALLEIALWLGGVPTLISERDPFQGFSGKVRVFELDHSTGVYRTPRRATRHSFNHQEFLASKPENGSRIFVLGGSSAYGFPWGARRAFPHLLGLALGEGRSAGAPVESINAAAMSYGSHRLRILAAELLDYAPDALVIYSGHNEFIETRFYREQIERPAELDRARRWLHHWRLYSLLARKLGALDESGSPSDLDPSEISPAELLGLDVVREYPREVADSDREEALARFEENLRAILAMARRADVPVLLCTVPSNLSGWAPNHSSFAAETTAEERRETRDLVAAAGRALARGDAAAAVESLERARELAPGHAELLYRLGQAYASLGRGASARELFLAARDADARPSRAPSALNEVIRRLGSEPGVTLVDVERAFALNASDGLPGFDLFEDYVHPKPRGHRLIALELWKRIRADGLLGEVRSADESTFDAALARAGAGPESEGGEPAKTPALLFNLAVVLENQGRIDEAIENYRACLELHPGYYVARANLARLLAKRGLDAEAIEQHRLVLEVRPDYVRSMLGLGESLRRMGRLDEALQLFERAVRSDSASAPAWRSMGITLMGMGRYPEAEEALRHSTRLDPGDVDAAVDLGYCLLYQSRFDDAGPAFRTVLELSPGHRRGRNGLAAVLTDRGELDRAEGMFRESLRLDPADAFARAGLEEIARRRSAG